MAEHLYIAPAGDGKTTFILARARAAALRWQSTRVVVASSRQSVAAHHRLTDLGGSMGVRIHTLFGLAREVLDRTGAAYTLISDPIQVRFLRALVDDAALIYYAPLVRKPGFIRALRTLFSELAYALVAPADFEGVVQAMGAPPRLLELARLYTSYHRQLAARQWMDRSTLLLQARAAAENAWPEEQRYGFLGVDGFMRLRPAELALLQQVARHSDETIITLTGDLPASVDITADAAATFEETIAQVADAFGVAPQPLPTPQTHTASQRRLHHEFVAAPDRVGEVRVALRWLKQQLVQSKRNPSQVALLARDITPYRQAILQIADEFGLPIHVSGGMPLRSNPGVAALLDLLQLTVSEPERRFPFRATLRAWRSPYFDWRWPEDDVRIELADADALDSLGRWGRVTAGIEQWEETFARRLRSDALQAPVVPEDGDSQLVQSRTQIEALHVKWQYFVAAITPPAGVQPARAWVRWLESLIGPEPAREEAAVAEDGPVPFSLNMVARIRNIEDDFDPVYQGMPDKPLVERDVAALIAFKEVLRGMVWAAETLHLPETAFPAFLTDLQGAIEAAHYEPGSPVGQGVIQAMSAPEAAGLHFEAVALLGLAEEQFPAVLREDTFLRGGDRKQMQQTGLAVPPSPRSDEAALWYVAITRSQARLLLTRPRLAEGGAPWQASPYWRLLMAQTGVQPRQRRHENMLEDAPIASRPELMLALAANSVLPERAAMIDAAGPRWTHWQHGHTLLQARAERHHPPPDGHLLALAPRFNRRFGPDYVWSAGQLEAYRQCPYRFFAAYVLHLDARPEPELGLDNRQLGSLYHRALEITFRRGAAHADDADALIAIWEEEAEPLLDAAPATYGFRPTAWWPQTRQQIKETIRRTLAALAAENAGWHPRAFEAVFGAEGKPALALAHDARAGDQLLLRGVIDRVDVDSQGRGYARILDYKRGGVDRYREKALAEGDYLQLPLYALAATQALEHGEPRDGFYWSITQAKPSSLRLRDVGVAEAVDLAQRHAWEAVDNARAGRFHPQTPPGGCPDFCPAAAFCWFYRPQHH